MDLSTTYLGLKLPHPLMPGASPLTEDMDGVRRLEDAGAAAIVLFSLFEEQIEGEEGSFERNLGAHGESFPEALSYFPKPEQYRLGPDDYLQHIRRIKAAVKLPVIASLNGSTPGRWLHYAGLMADAGADALELNVYFLPTEPGVTGRDVEERATTMAREVKKCVKIPVAVKLSPFYSSLPSFARQLEAAGVDGIVLFNRFYQPDLDVEALEVTRVLQLSDSSELLLRLRWTAILSGHVGVSIGVSGGVHTPLDALKAVMAGASGVQMVSALLRGGPERLKVVREGMASWLEEHEYVSLQQALGSMNLMKCPDPAAYERANYVQILQSWGR